MESPKAVEPEHREGEPCQQPDGDNVLVCAFFFFFF